VTATIRVATAGDYGEVVRLLEDANLPTAGLGPTLPDFLVAEEGGRIVGAVGFELYGESALLRSAVVAQERRDTGLGTHLVERLLQRADSKGVREIYLLTTTADRFFPRFGFAAIPRAGVAAAVHASEEFRGTCPDSAVVMRRATRSV
jgi:N-acetylglutamate synthase-like GNAT family acetyltransferase